MRLKALISTLPSFERFSSSYESIVNGLESLDIPTAEDLVLRHSPEDLVCRLSTVDIDSDHFFKFYEEVVTALTPSPVLGCDLYEREAERLLGLGDPLQVGAASIDSVLQLPLCGIVEVAGLAGTGKTVTNNHELPQLVDLTIVIYSFS